ncbi:MAG: TetR/AcrR family transcriptional regulator [Vicinamibacterales bacterium]|nr:TetR/AcrR family transcriptional regulator [Vicinamibacterales bacterium]
MIPAGNLAKTPSVTHPTSAERILSTALDLFAVKGYDATSVREICEAADITKPTLYHFYGSKDGVLRALVNSGFDRFRRLVDSALETPGTFRDKAKLVARGLFTSATEQPRYWRFMHSIVWAPSGTSPKTADCQAFYEGVVGALEAAALDAVKRGEISPGPMNIRMLILMGAIGEAATGYVISGRPVLTPQLADGLIDAILDGWSS